MNRTGISRVIRHASVSRGMGPGSTSPPTTTKSTRVAHFSEYGLEREQVAVDVVERSDLHWTLRIGRPQ
jgi:hypothetical protein